MPFRDQEWEELQRDCDIFPAYSDFLYGPDPRIITTQEPGLHPMIYPIDASAPIRYTNSMPSRTWSHKTTEDPEKSKNATAQTLLAGQNEPGSDMSGANNGRSTHGSYVHSQTSSLLNPLLPPQSVCTISEEDMARRKTLNVSQRRRRSQTVVPFSPSQQQQPVGMTEHQIHTRNTPVIHSADVEPQQPSFLRSSSTTDIDETLAQMGSRQKSDAFSPFALQTTMLPPPANLSQRQPQHATGLSNNLPPIPAPNDSPESSQQISLLQPNDILRNSRYDCINPAKRLEIAKVLVDRWVVVRNSAADDALGGKGHVGHSKHHQNGQQFSHQCTSCDGSATTEDTAAPYAGGSRESADGPYTACPTTPTSYSNSAEICPTSAPTGHLVRSTHPVISNPTIPAASFARIILQYSSSFSTNAGASTINSHSSKTRTSTSNLQAKTPL
ncbi:unnamed protein product [Alternaria alternata]